MLIPLYFIAVSEYDVECAKNRNLIHLYIAEVAFNLLALGKWRLHLGYCLLILHLFILCYLIFCQMVRNIFFKTIFPSSGGGPNFKFAKKAIRLARYGCANRPFYHVVVILKGRNQHSQPIEQLGTYDPIPNERNEKLVTFNCERIQYWLGEGADISKPVAELLGLSGFLPVHPRSYMTASRNRQAKTEEPAISKEREEKH